MLIPTKQDGQHTGLHVKDTQEQDTDAMRDGKGPWSWKDALSRNCSLCHALAGGAGLDIPNICILSSSL